MKISRIELYHVRIPLPEVFYPSWIPGFPQMYNSFTLLRIITSDGIEGYSAGASLGREREGLGHLIGPYFIDMDPTDIEKVQQRLREMAYLGWRNHWIEPACWDIIAKDKGLPLYKLLGGEEGKINLYASFGEVMGPEKIAEECGKRIDEGFKGIKIRVHDFDENIDRGQVRSAIQVAGKDVKVGVDANQGWRVTLIQEAPLWDLDRAKRFADFCAEHGVEWIEEPLPMDDYIALSKLKRYSKVKIAGGELNGGGYPEFKMMLEKDCYHIYQPDATFCGGISQVRKIMNECNKKRALFTPHTWTNGIGFAINLHLFASYKKRDEMLLEYPYNPPSWIPEARDGILKEPFIHHRGTLTLPKTPGLGIEIDWKSLRKYGKRFFIATKRRVIFYMIKERGLRETIKLAKVIKR